MKSYETNSLDKISIIVAIYKSERFLDKCITSICNQTYKNLEIILIDDGSPDKSAEICDKYAAKDDRIIVIHKENGGTCSARNAGLKIASGEYIVIVDGDDWLSLDFVEYMVKIIKTTGAEMAMTDNIFTTRDRVQINKDSIKKITSEEAVASLLYPYIIIGPWNKMYKTSLLKNNNIDFSVPWSGEGLYFIVTAAQNSNYVGLGHKKVYNYRLNNTESGLTNYNVQMGINALSNIKTIKKELKIKSATVMNAVNWHIWKNYYFILLLITATNSKKRFYSLYRECKKQNRMLFFPSIHNANLKKQQKLKCI
ncbi:glycosyltransferase family 2 protein [Thomasclavelia sp.]|uniref:glycosyltransferase family 2 protein n=1 Tax=Thomasclavelia sp. TaxID=3025757 RepID=UPI0025EE2DB9|nr:glycosyltransferase family 2 protein [Thomasclavelia sp.]